MTYSSSGLDFPFSRECVDMSIPLCPKVIRLHHSHRLQVGYEEGRKKRKGLVYYFLLDVICKDPGEDVWLWLTFPWVLVQGKNRHLCVRRLCVLCPMMANPWFWQVPTRSWGTGRPLHGTRLSDLSKISYRQHVSFCKKRDEWGWGGVGWEWETSQK